MQDEPDSDSIQWQKILTHIPFPKTKNNTSWTAAGIEVRKPSLVHKKNFRFVQFQN